MLTIDELAATADVPVILAARWRRLAAFCIDTVAGIVGRVLIVAAAGTWLSPVVWLLASAAGVGQIILISIRGQSAGKWCVGIAIVDQADRVPPGFIRAALIRGLPQMVLSVFAPTVGAFYVIVDALPIFLAQRRCIHDYLAGTIVIWAPKARALADEVQAA